MRRIYTNEVVVLIAGLLLAAAVVFAWQRSKPPAEVGEVRSTDAAVQHDDATGDAAGDTAGDATADATFAWQVTGARTYQARCATCHDQGEASPRVPPLRGHVASLHETTQGRTYLAGFMLFGRDGAIEVDGRTYPPRHPMYADRLSDEQIAAVLNYVLTAWDDDAPQAELEHLYVPGDIAAQRQQAMTPQQVQALRDRLTAE